MYPDRSERIIIMYQAYMKGYIGLVAFLDDNIGRLSNYIDEAGLKDSTMVIYTSDNGFFLGDHGFYNKMWMYEEALHIPLIIRHPKDEDQDLIAVYELPVRVIFYSINNLCL